MSIQGQKNCDKCHKLEIKLKQLYVAELNAQLNFQPIRDKIFKIKKKLYALDSVNYLKPTNWDSRLRPLH
jgi:hypothetical protein